MFLRNLKTPVWCFLLLPVFFLLHSYNELFGFISLSYLLIFALCINLLAGVIFGIAFLVTRSVLHASFITFCSLVLFLFWGSWHDLVKSVAGQSAFGRYAVVLPLSLVFFTALVWYFFKKPAQLQPVLKYISYVVIILCALDIGNLFLHYRQYRKDRNLIYSNRAISDNYVSCKQPDSSKPDIYFIILDEYTNNKTLEKFWQYDNSGITNWLSEKGFYIPGNSKANYSFTPYSISSMLNMNYLNFKQGNITDLPYFILKAVHSMSDNETFGILQKENYRFHYISPFNNSFENLRVEKEFDQFSEKKLFNQTLPGRMMADFAYKFGPSPVVVYKKKDSEYRYIINRIKSTVDTAANRPPQMVYGHLMITHRPHIYDATGAIRTEADIRQKTPLFNTYLNQVQQANRTIQELVTHILTNNKKNTLMLIMGDHGFRRFPDSQSRYYFPNFTAFYFPGKSYPPALGNISAVNTFRIVFNQYFCQDLKLLKDSSIIVKY